ncbi:cysteine dioxygenase type 1-like [Corticium candelabrum]|uniref:cysteine dioxygenase type 1-like n=1 Tax=Corticium candelabrum TaxID=121492 RepID=UPI002E264B48|nr:cysteine dioxygenase type 1-like [Corticium candelabrum]
MTMSDLRLRKTLDELVDLLHEALAGDTADVKHIEDLMEGYTSNADEWRSFTSFDKNKYTRQLVDSGNGKFNLLILCWSEGQGSCIHSHAGSHCFMKILQGSLKETRYEWPKEGESAKMTPTESFDLKRDEVAYMSDTLGLHRVENSSHTEKAVSLHLYSPPFDLCHWFDERTSTKHTCRITFTNMEVKKVAAQANELETACDEVCCTE